MPEERAKTDLQSRRVFLKRTVQGAIVAGFVFSAAGSEHVTLSRLTVRVKGLPASLAGLKLAFASDFHHNSDRSLPLTREAIDVLNSVRADVILLGGDYVTMGAHRFSAIMAELGRLSAPQGVYSVPGNHDNVVSANVYRRELSKAGIRDITNKGFAIEKGGGSVWIAGLDDEWTGYPKPDLAIEGAPANAPRIVVTHNPTLADELPSGYADLILAGHTHGWQVYVPLVTSLVVPQQMRKYRAGFYRTPAGLMYVTRGIGTIGESVRFWCSPEVVLVTLQPGG